MIIYTNGVNTTETEALEHAQIIERMTGHTTVLNYNQTHGLVVDVLEALWGRWFFWVRRTTPALKLQRMIEYHYGETQMYLMAHSQGTIITINAVRGLQPFHKEGMKLFLFAPVNSFKPEGYYVEYWVNRADWVVKLLPGRYILKAINTVKDIFKPVSKKHGLVLEREGMGHSLEYAYLKKINKFRSHKLSEFYKLVHPPQEPSHDSA